MFNYFFGHFTIVCRNVPRLAENGSFFLRFRKRSQNTQKIVEHDLYSRDGWPVDDAVYLKEAVTTADRAIVGDFAEDLMDNREISVYIDAFFR